MASVRSSDLRGFSTLVLLSIAFYLVVLALMHLVRPDVSVLGELTSAYASGSLGWLMRVGVVVSAVGWVVLAYGLSRGLPRAALPVSGTILLSLAALGVLLQVLIPGFVGPVPFQLLIVAAALLTVSFGRYPQWRSLRGRSLALTILMVLGFFAVAGSLRAEAGTAGLAQRVFIVVTVSWIVVVAAHLRGVAPATEASRSAGMG